MLKIAPSLLSADFLHLEKDIQMLNKSADIIHLDVMDGTQVPNISFGFSVLDPLSKVATIPTDAHLMVVHPERWFEHLAKNGTTMVSFHYEASGRNTRKYLRQLKEMGIKAGVAINPDIPVEKLFNYIGEADFFLIMSVFAGFGGQKFIYESIDRVAALRAEITKRGLDTEIEVDGGCSPANAAALREAGANILVAGSAVFKSEDPAATINVMRQA